MVTEDQLRNRIEVLETELELLQENLELIDDDQFQFLEETAIAADKLQAVIEELYKVLQGYF